MAKRERVFGRDKRIPYSAMWSSEKWAMIRPCRYTGGRLALFSEGRQGEGTPILGKMLEYRQRELMAEQRCDICHRHIKGDSYFVSDANRTVLADGRERACITQPPVCEPCFIVAIGACIGLKRQIEDGSIRAGIVRSFNLVMQQLDPKQADFIGLDGNDGKPFIGYIKYEPIRFTMLSLDQIKEMRGS